jgi:DNA-directed RNA polymerase specialized sigma24 family protein
LAASLDRLSRAVIVQLIAGRERPEQAWMLDFVGLKQGEIAELLQISQSGVSRAISRHKAKQRDSGD